MRGRTLANAVELQWLVFSGQWLAGVPWLVGD